MTTKSTSTVTISFLSRTGKASIQIKASDLKVALEIQVKSGADLSGADLSGADLSRADLSGAKWRDGVIINRRPLFIGGLSWSVWVLDSHMQIGCELHKLSEWAEFDDRRICQMSGKEAVKFWRTYKDVLLAIAKSDGRE